MLRSLKLSNGFWCDFFDRVIQEGDLYVYNVHNIGEKHFSISIAPERSRGGSLVNNNLHFLLLWDFTVAKYYRNYIDTYIVHTTHAWFPMGQKRYLRYSSKTPTFYQNDLAIRNTAGMTCGKPIIVWSQSISGGSAINSLVAFYDIHGRKGEVLFFCAIPDTNVYDYVSRTSKILDFNF
jgi:hypothetical protein